VKEVLTGIVFVFEIIAVFTVRMLWKVIVVKELIAVMLRMMSGLILNRMIVENMTNSV
jgi:hypothetical protein